MGTINLFSVVYSKNYMLYLMNNNLSQGFANIFLKGQVVKTLSFAGHTIFWLLNVATIAQKWPIDNTY